MEKSIRPKTVTLIGKLLNPLVDEGVVTTNELREIIANLRHLAIKGTLVPAIVPKLIDQREAAEMLGIGLSNFKKIEREGSFPFPRRMVGAAVRYRNTDIVKFILAEDEPLDMTG